MCMEYALKCSCGSSQASFHFQDNLMPPEVITGLYCPTCSDKKNFDAERMVRDNGWMIEYDMEVAKFSAHKLPHGALAKLSPETLFDAGFATWRGVYPGDHIDSAVEREEIIKLARIDPKAYMTKMRDWANGRMNRLKSEGWRKAQDAA